MVIIYFIRFTKLQVKHFRNIIIKDIEKNYDVKINFIASLKYYLHLLDFMYSTK